LIAIRLSVIELLHCPHTVEREQHDFVALLQYVPLEQHDGPQTVEFVAQVSIACTITTKLQLEEGQVEQPLQQVLGRLVRLQGPVLNGLAHGVAPEVNIAALFVIE